MDLNRRAAFQHLISSRIYGSITQTASPGLYFTSLRYLKQHASDSTHTHTHTDEKYREKALRIMELASKVWAVLKHFDLIGWICTTMWCEHKQTLIIGLKLIVRKNIWLQKFCVGRGDNNVSLSNKSFFKKNICIYLGHANLLHAKKIPCCDIYRWT